MVYEKKQLIVRRVICVIVAIVGLVLMIAGASPSHSLAVVDSSGFVEMGSVYSDCKIVAYFEEEIAEAEIVVSFFDAEGNEVERKTLDYGLYEGKSATFTVMIFDEVDSYQIIDGYALSQKGEDMMVFGSLLFVFGLIFLASRLFIKCKVFDFEGKEIIVYAGTFFHYIKVEGHILDRYTWILALFMWIPLVWLISLFLSKTMSCVLDDGTKIEVEVASFHRIKVKINDRLYY